MGFLNKLLGSQKENIFIEIGEIDSFPYCNKKQGNSRNLSKPF